MNGKNQRKSISIAQFGTGTNIDLLPLAAGLLYSRLKQETQFLKDYRLGDIVFRRQDDIAAMAEDLGDVFALGLSCSLWNMNMSLVLAHETRQRNPDALIVCGGPSIAKDPEYIVPFFDNHPYVDVIILSEGEEAWVSALKYHAKGKNFDDIPGIAFRDRTTGEVRFGEPIEVLDLSQMPSPFLDGTFDELWEKHEDQFSGIIWETNRGCPFTCTFCTWGSKYTSRKVRYNSMERIRQEIDWIGRRGIKYIAFTDANFGINKRDVEICRMLAECKKKYGGPNFISVSWVKNSSNKVLVIGDILRKAGINFRVTLALQSTNPEVLKVINRDNMKQDAFYAVQKVYHEKRLFSYTELMLGLPVETHESYLNGIEDSLSDSVFNQIYIYPMFLFPNTEMSSTESVEKYGLIGKTTTGGYTKSKNSYNIGETVDIVIGTGATPKPMWVESFVLGFFTTGMHGDRILFFVLEYLRKVHDVRVTDLFCFAKAFSYQENLTTLVGIFEKLRLRALSVQNEGTTHLIEPSPYGGMCFDPPQAAFLEMLYYRESFFPEMAKVVDAYLISLEVEYDAELLADLFVFQAAVIAHPDGPVSSKVHLRYDWVEYFKFAYNFDVVPLVPREHTLTVVDEVPVEGDTSKFLAQHFDIRGVPAFNIMFDEEGKKVFPPVEMTAAIELAKVDIDEDANTNDSADATPVVAIPQKDENAFIRLN